MNKFHRLENQIEWPQRSQDLSPPDIFLLGYLKSVINKIQLALIEEFRKEISQECRAIIRTIFVKFVQDLEILYKKELSPV